MKEMWFVDAVKTLLGEIHTGRLRFAFSLLLLGHEYFPLSGPGYFPY